MPWIRRNCPLTVSCLICKMALPAMTLAKTWLQNCYDLSPIINQCGHTVSSHQALSVFLDYLTPNALLEDVPKGICIFEHQQSSGKRQCLCQFILGSTSFISCIQIILPSEQSNQLTRIMPVTPASLAEQYCNIVNTISWDPDSMGT